MDPILDLAIIRVADENNQPVYDLQPATITDVDSKNPI